jgi:hypothetical protein
VVRRRRRWELGVEGARIEDGPEFLRWIRAGRSTLQHPDRQPNADIGVNGVLLDGVICQRQCKQDRVRQSSYRFHDRYCDIATMCDGRVRGRVRNLDTLRKYSRDGERGESEE